MVVTRCEYGDRIRTKHAFSLPSLAPHTVVKNACIADRERLVRQRKFGREEVAEPGVTAGDGRCEATVGGTGALSIVVCSWISLLLRVLRRTSRDA